MRGLYGCYSEAVLVGFYAIFRKNTLRKMSEAVDDNDMIAYMKMTDDYLFYRILYSEEPELMRSRELLESIQRRKLHKFVGQTQLKGDQIKPKVRPIIIFSGFFFFYNMN